MKARIGEKLTVVRPPAKMEAKARERRAKRPMMTITSLRETFAMQQNPKSKGRMVGMRQKKESKQAEKSTRGN